MVRKWNDFRDEWMEDANKIISSSHIINPKRPRQCTDHTGPDSPYWQSTEAFNLFGLVSQQEGEDNDNNIDLRQVIKDRIVILKSAWTTATGWEDIVSGKRSDLERFKTHLERDSTQACKNKDVGDPGRSIVGAGNLSKS